jgi:predicted adenine nucleotide alpha hydrolase (AANH) superfamily ATPase
MNINYSKVLDNKIKELQKDNKVPSLLLHSCCAPCSSYVLEYLSNYFKITVFYYNPNIYPEEEYRRRAKEQEMLYQTLRRNMRLNLLKVIMIVKAFML